MKKEDNVKNFGYVFLLIKMFVTNTNIALKQQSFLQKKKKKKSKEYFYKRIIAKTTKNVEN